MKHLIPLALLTAASAPAFLSLAQSSIDPVDKYAWSENCGWLNWYDAGDPPATQGAMVFFDHMTGFVWGENIGWVNLGNGGPYANTDNTNYGVNVDPAGLLTGYAWAENVGWINFSGGGLATPAVPAWIDMPERRFRGYAWAENIGWINLDNADHFVKIGGACADTDFNNDGIFPDIQDLFDFLNVFAGGACSTGLCDSIDFNGDAIYPDITDLNSFLSVFAGGAC